MDFTPIRSEAAKVLKQALETAPRDASYVRGRAAPRPDAACAHDGLARQLKLAPCAWGATHADRSGALEKLPVSGLMTSRKVAKWKKRHFVLRNDVVAWFKPVGGDGGPAEKLPPAKQAAAAKACAEAWAKAEVHGELTNSTALTASSAVRQNKSDLCSFKVERCVAPDGTRGKLRLRATTPADAKAWMAQFERMIGACKASAADGLESPRTPFPRSSTDDEALPPSPSATAGYAMPPSARPAGGAAGRAGLHKREPSDPEVVDAAMRLARTSFSDAGQTATPRATVEWISCADDNGRVYFVHRPTGRTQWDLPPGWTTSSSGWAARVDANTGHTYYFFPPTGETTWTLPER